MSTETVTYAPVNVGHKLYAVRDWGTMKPEEVTVVRVSAKRVTVHTDGGEHLPSYNRQAERIEAAPGKGPGYAITSGPEPVCSVGGLTYYRTPHAALWAHADRLVERADDAEQGVKVLRIQAQDARDLASRIANGEETT